MDERYVGTVPGHGQAAVALTALAFVRTVLAVALLVATVAAPAGSVPPVAGVPPVAVTAGMTAMLDAYAARVADPRLPVATGQIADAALLALLARGDVGLAQTWFDRAFGAQDMDASSATYGELKVDTHDAAITDLNAVQFASLPLGAALAGYGDRFSPTFLQAFRPHVVAALAGVEHERVPVTYTNMYLMKTVNLMLLGRALHDASAIAEGHRQLTTWIAATRAAGVHEFESPTYYAVDLFSLNEGYRYSENPGDRRAFAAALDYLWTDIAANNFAPASKMNGPYSREYDFVAGNGILSVWLAAIGWAPASEFDHSNPLFVYVYDALRPGGYTVPAALAELAHGGPREVTSTWDDVPTHTRWDWLGRGVALGCTSGTYDSEDRFVTGSFAGAPGFPQMSVMPEQDAMPYGATTTRAKSDHLALAAGCVEHAGVALVTWNLPPFLTARRPVGLFTDVVLPADARLAVDGRPVRLAVPGAVPVDRGAVVSASTADGTIAVRLVHADPVDGIAPRVELVTDATGLARHVVWLRVTHVAAGVASNAQRALVGLLVVARDGADSAAAIDAAHGAAISDEIRGTTWALGATIGGERLEVERSSTDRNAILAQRVDGQTPPRAVLAVDGRDLAGPAWALLDH